MTTDQQFTRREQTRRYLAAGILMIMPAAFTVGWLQWKDQLPHTLPTHWNASGVPDGFSNTAAYTAILAGIVVLATIVGLVAAMSRRWPRGTERFWLAGVGGVQGMAVALWFVSAFVTIDHGDPYTAPLGGWVFLVVVSIAWGAVPALLYPPSPARESRVTSSEQHPDVPAEPWSDTVSSTLMVWLTVLTVVIGLALIFPFLITGEVWMPIIGIFVVACAVPVLMLAKYLVSINGDGLRVSSSLIGLPLKTLSLDEIETASAGEIRPEEWGGWGWRVAPGRSAVIMRRGNALTVKTVAGKEFAVTLSGADEAAAVLNAYLKRYN